VDEAAEAAEYVQRYIRAGFHTPDEIERIVGRDIFGGKLAAGPLRAVIAQERQQQLAEEATWPKETDCDRLDAVFATLERQGIVALQNAGYTMSDGLSDVFSVYHQAGGPASEFNGYCFYHGQDLESAIEIGCLHLAFGATDDSPIKGVRVGRRIKGVLEATGFSVAWDGSIETRILVTGIRWQRRCTR
jgi:hypothetical protein